VELEQRYCEMIFARWEALIERRAPQLTDWEASIAEARVERSPALRPPYVQDASDWGPKTDVARVFAGRAAGVDSRRLCVAKRIPVAYRTLDLPQGDPNRHIPGGEWWFFSGMGTGLDGTIYSGLCDHRFQYTGALLIAYHPGTGAVRHLADMQEVCGQRHRYELMGQTKIHTRIAADSDGRIYLGTHSCERDYAPPELKEKLTGGYPGGHWIRYDLDTDLCEDLGIAVAGESLMGFALDPRTHRIYATTHTKALLVEFDIASLRTEVIGSVGKYPTRVVERTADGTVYTFDDEGRVVRFDPRSRELRTLDAQLPGFEGDVNMLTSFCTVVGLDGHTIYGVSTAFHMEPREPMGEVVEGRKMEFRPGYAFAYETQYGSDGQMRRIGPAGGGSNESVSDLQLHHAITLTRNGDAMYVSARGDQPAHLIMIDLEACGSQAGAVATRGEKVIDLGEMWGDGEEGYVETALAATTGLDGTVYFGGPRKSDKYVRDHVRWALIMLPDGCWL
jgi:hypothetical protein